MSDEGQTPVLKRRYRSMPERKAAFVDVQRGIFLYEDGLTKFEYDTALSLASILDLIAEGAWDRRGPEIIYIIGCWNAASTPAREWFEASTGWERTSYHRNPIIALYRNGSKHVTLYGSAQWFGQCGEIELVQAAYVRLRVLLRESFGQEVNLMGTPARTGLDLIERSLPTDRDKRSYEWPVLPREIREVIEHNIGQGRMEMLRQIPEMPKAEKLYIEDAIWMYSACCRRLPSGPVQHDTVDEFAGYRVGFYRIEFQVPSGWHHIGLIPTWNPKEKRSIWPSRPSTYWYTGYVCAEELRIALEPPEGLPAWPVRIKERWLFESGDSLAQDPLRNWIEKLRALRESCTETVEGELLAPLLRSAIRSICIKAIGSLHRKGRYQVVETPISRLADIPEDAEVVFRSGTHVRWRKPISLDASMAHFAHPEWSAYIWGRARARLAKAALSLPRETLIALRSDAIAVTFDPGWRGSKPGEFRLKRIIDLDGRSLPKTTQDYLNLLQDPEEE